MVDVGREFALMSQFSQVIEAELARARDDPAFRQRLLQQSLDILLCKLRKERKTARDGTADAQLRKGVTLAVRLAELIQTAVNPQRDP
jgi:hypothetical protein